MTAKKTKKMKGRRCINVRRATARNRKKPAFIIRECGKTHYVYAKAESSSKVFKLVQDTGSENTYIDLEMANAWGLMKGKTPLVPFRESTTIDSNGSYHKSVRLNSVLIEIKCPDGIFRGSRGPVEVNLDQKVNKFGRLYGVSHIRTLRDSVKYTIDFTKCSK